MKSKNSSPVKVQMSTAAAMTLGFFPGEFLRNAKLKALNLLVTYESGCQARCSFCGLSKSRETAGDETKSFIRVMWPSFDLDEIIERTKSIPHLKRVCVSMITHKYAFQDMCTIMRKFKEETKLSISGLIGPTNIQNIEMLEEIKHSGTDMVGIAIDAATPELFEKLRGKSVGGPHKWSHYWKVVRESVGIFGEYNVGVHLIVGLGETEKEMVHVIQKAYDLRAKTHLFSFYPEEGSKMQYWHQPSYGYYRRIQLARYIINEGYGSFAMMRFDENDKLIDFGLDEELLEELIQSGEVFMTSGCAGSDGTVACNRPFGNERPSRPIRNFPFKPNQEDIELIKKQLWEQ